MIEDPTTMKSPITGGKVSLQWEWRDMTFRKETYRVMFPFFRCEDTGEQFTTTESDGVWYRQMHQQYCHKYGIPYIDEIINLRKQYGVNATKMSLILGFGENQYRKYEQEEIPNPSNGKMIRSAMNPRVFLDLVESSKELLSDKEYSKIAERVNAIISESEARRQQQYETQRIFTSTRSEENGFAPTSLTHLRDIMLLILKEYGEVFCTKMNKLLFYIDFLSYRQRGIAMTGLSYRAIEFGPAPEHWDRIYSEFDEIQQQTRLIGEYEGNVLVANNVSDNTSLTDDEKSIIRTVCSRFKECTSIEISRISHKEPAWLKYHETQARIPYAEAFELQAL